MMARLPKRFFERPMSTTSFQCSFCRTTLMDVLRNTVYHSYVVQSMPNGLSQFYRMNSVFDLLAWVGVTIRHPIPQGQIRE